MTPSASPFYSRILQTSWVYALRGMARLDISGNVPLRQQFGLIDGARMRVDFQ